MSEHKESEKIEEPTEPVVKPTDTQAQYEDVSDMETEIANEGDGANPGTTEGEGTEGNASGTEPKEGEEGFQLSAKAAHKQWKKEKRLEKERLANEKEQLAEE